MNLTLTPPTVMLARTKLGRPAAKLPRKHACKVVSIWKAMFHRHLVDGFVRQGERLPRESKTRGQDVSSRRVSHVLPKHPDESVQAHASTLCQESIR